MASLCYTLPTFILIFHCTNCLEPLLGKYGKFSKSLEYVCVCVYGLFDGAEFELYLIKLYEMRSYRTLAYHYKYKFIFIRKIVCLLIAKWLLESLFLYTNVSKLIWRNNFFNYSSITNYNLCSTALSLIFIDISSTTRAIYFYFWEFHVLIFFLLLCALLFEADSWRYVHLSNSPSVRFCLWIELFLMPCSLQRLAAGVRISRELKGKYAIHGFIYIIIVFM